MKNFVTLYDVVSNKAYYDYEKREYIVLSDEEREKAFAAMKKFVADSARGKRKDRILRAGYPNVEGYWGIATRLWYYPETETVYYCIGQDGQNERAILRDMFD